MEESVASVPNSHRITVYKAIKCLHMSNDDDNSDGSF